MYDILLTLSDPVGIVGVILILIAYYYLSVGGWIAKSMKFQLMNFFGAWLILFSLYFHWNTASVTIEIAWIIISIVGMCRIKGCGIKQGSN
jgi:SNF family Na+-dependent transporter